MSAPLFVSTFGSGRPILALHGVESHGVRFLAFAARLRGARVVAPDLPGHGRSPKEGPWTLERTVADLLPILRELEGTDSPLVLGHSYGGLLAWELAGAASSEGLGIGGLVLVDPAIAVGRSVAQSSTTYEATTVGHRWPDEQAALADLMAGHPADGRWAGALDAAVALERDADGWLVPLLSADAVAAAWSHMQVALSASSYRGPTLLIEAGREHGRYVSPSVVGGMRALLGDELTHVVVDTTHTITSDYPNLLAEAVAEFMSSL